MQEPADKISFAFALLSMTVVEQDVMHCMFYRIQTRETHLRPLVSGSPTMMTWLFSGEADPPIPPGATKFSYSTRLGEIRVRLCDTDMDFLELKVCVSVCMHLLVLFVCYVHWGRDFN
jgi:hypothetical protein